jgi:hypothetical protein
MDQAPLSTHDIFPHIRIVMGMVIGLGVTRLLSGVARIIQHPRQYPLYPIHLAWVAMLLLMLVHFWWWEIDLYVVTDWTFGKYIFVVFYAITLFLMCALLFPDSMLDYRGYEEFFYARRAWFFGLLALTYVLDVVDTLLKGRDYFARFDNEYWMRTPVMMALCIAAIAVRDWRYHALFVTGALIYQISWIFRLFDTII